MLTSGLPGFFEGSKWSPVGFPFQSLLGFSGCCDTQRLSDAVNRRSVSIPSRVFWVLRPDGRHSKRLTSSFNPFAGFLGAATRQRWRLQHPESEFQSLRGFSGCCDRTTDCESWGTNRFNPFAGFLGAATLEVRVPFGADDVSIPSRVFWVLRRIESKTVSDGSTVFQSLRGFSGCCDLFAAENIIAPLSFNPFAGFLGAATDSPRDGTTPGRMFQSLRGFSGCCDVRTNNTINFLRFQSLRGFSGCCDVAGADGFGAHCCFNPFAGFLGAATTSSPTRPAASAAFQSLRGFSGCCDRPTASRDHRHRDVSIPSRVFWVLRPRHYSTSRGR